MNEAASDWLAGMAELEGDLAISAGGSPFRHVAMQNAPEPIDEDWLDVMNEIERDLPVSARGTTDFLSGKAQGN